MKRQPTYALFEAWMTDDAVRATPVEAKEEVT